MGNISVQSWRREFGGGRWAAASPENIKRPMAPSRGHTNQSYLLTTSLTPEVLQIIMTSFRTDYTGWDSSPTSETFLIATTPSEGTPTGRPRRPLSAETKFSRQLGACLRCRILKKKACIIYVSCYSVYLPFCECSSQHPCNRCFSVPGIRPSLCIRTSLHDVNIFAISKKNI